MNIEKRYRELIKFMLLFYSDEVYEKWLEDEAYKRWLEWRNFKKQKGEGKMESPEFVLVKDIVDHYHYEYAVCMCHSLDECIRIKRPLHSDYIRFNCPRCGNKLGVMALGMFEKDNHEVLDVCF